MQDLKSGRAGARPGAARIDAVEQPVFGAGDQASGAAAIHANRFGIFPPDAAIGGLPGGAAIAADADAGGMGEVDGARGIAVHSEIAQFGDIVAGQNLPGAPVIGGANQPVAGGKVERGRVARIVVERADERVSKADMLPRAAGRLLEDAAGRKRRANEVAARGDHARVEPELGGEREGTRSRKMITRIGTTISGGRWCRLVCAGRLQAKIKSGTITGRVSDQTNSVIAGADVFVTNESTNVTVETSTNGVGEYGVYTVSYLAAGTEGVSNQGFASDNIKAAAGETYRVTFSSREMPARRVALQWMAEHWLPIGDPVEVNISGATVSAQPKTHYVRLLVPGQEDPSRGIDSMFLERQR